MGASYSRIKLTRAQSILIAVSALVCFFIGGGLLVGKKRPALTPPPLSSEESKIETAESRFANGGASLTGKIDTPAKAASEDPDASSPLTMKTFHRSEVRDGKKLWEITATEGRFFPERSAAEVVAPDFWVFTKSGDKIQIQSEKAVLHLSGAGLAKAELVGKVHVVENDELVIDTEQAVYDKTSNSVTAPGAVKLTSPSFDISGIGLEAQVDTQYVRLLSNVESVIRPNTPHARGNSLGEILGGLSSPAPKMEKVAPSIEPAGATTNKKLPASKQRQKKKK